MHSKINRFPCYPKSQYTSWYSQPKNTKSKVKTQQICERKDNWRIWWMLCTQQPTQIISNEKAKTQTSQ